MEISKTKIQIKAFGKDLEISPPSALKVAQFKKEIGDVEKDEMALILKSHEFLKSCGVPQEICEDLEIHHITKLIEMISVKKN